MINSISKSPIPFVERLKRFYFFFPFQLVLIHLKNNHALLGFWLLIGAIISKMLLAKFGAHSLFLYPEYLGKVNFTSHLILGISLGGFIMAFNISSYVLNGIKFPFLATLRNPFIKYCLNNFIIPVSFFAYYLFELYYYQRFSELESTLTVLKHILGLICGMFFFLSITLSFFLSTNKNFRKLFGDISFKKRNDSPIRPIQDVLSKRERWYSFLTKKSTWTVSIYLSTPFKIQLARDISHYDKKMLQTVFAQNNLNASIFQLLVILSIVFFSVARETELFELPAAASSLLLLTMIIMISSAIYSWLGNWSTLAFVVVLLSYNALTTLKGFSFKSEALGLDYTEQALYSNDKVRTLNADKESREKDLAQHIQILENWKKKQLSEKPKLIVMNASGGGLRAAVWSMQVLQHLDKKTNNQFSRQLHLVTGSSGGMLGVGLYRELMLQHQLFGLNHLDSSYVYKLSKDLLNPIFLNLTLHDWLFRWKKMEHNGMYYRKDRGLSFEEQFIENTGCFDNRMLGDYAKYERSASIPMMILSPTIANDARRLNISSVPIGFLSPNDQFNKLQESVELRKLMAPISIDSLRFISALRMSATFFYVLPNVNLPTTPQIEVMDAGIRDNLGFINSFEYIFALKDWIMENTSGVLIVQVKDRNNDVDIRSSTEKTLFSSIKTPLQGVYSNYLNIQEFGLETMLVGLDENFANFINIVSYDMEIQQQSSVSLSWHLTKKEKQTISQAINAEHNKQTLKTIFKNLDHIK